MLAALANWASASVRYICENCTTMTAEGAPAVSATTVRISFACGCRCITPQKRSTRIAAAG